MGLVSITVNRDHFVVQTVGDCLCRKGWFCGVTVTELWLIVDSWPLTLPYHVGDESWLVLAPPNEANLQ